MKIGTRFNGNVIELIVRGWNATIIEDVANLKTNKIPKELIQQLQDAADEFEKHNKSLE